MFDVPKTASYNDLLYSLKENVRLLARSEGLWGGHFSVYYARAPATILVRQGINSHTSQVQFIGSLSLATAPLTLRVCSPVHEDPGPLLDRCRAGHVAHPERAIRVHLPIGDAEHPGHQARGAPRS